MDIYPDSIQNDYTGWNLTGSAPCIGKPDSEYLTPYYSEPQYEELSQTLVKLPASQQVEPTQHAPLNPTPHTSVSEYITPIPGGDRRQCSKPTLTLLRNFLISGIFNILLLAVLAHFSYTAYILNNSPEDSQPMKAPPPSAATILRGLEGTELCFFTKHIRCKGGLLRKSHEGVRSVSSRNSSLENSFQTEFPSMCCYYQSQSIQKLAHLFVLVKSHNKVRKVNTSHPDFVMTSDMSIACKMAVSADRRLQMYDNKDINCNGGIHVKRTRMHFLYLYLEINCSMHGTNVIRAGVKSEDEVVAEKEMHCDKKAGFMTLSVFLFKNLTQGAILVPFVSHTQCVNNDKDSNRFEILTL
ncbi:uncharacterized protein LOC110467431 [Mizuhopecten yessoensis]|uniref:uncharacterized protein LOC110467431 n=1 Tax=Mizuhopecten yessoensis TaxID=6573 RepID=UPI000B45CBB0|nr:uncharacterized protein LOC110467431 [Mizuhopecten yessoensis]XP_021380283.1 uncharacterized protein LOC110467431 [Mizuhopecten yessoensis]